MSDLTVIAQAIHDAMQAMEEGHKAGEDLRNNTNHETFDELRVKMAKVHERLSKLQTVLDNEEAYAIDELVDALSNIFMGHPAEYRKTPRMGK